jgi:mannosyltransferase
MADAGILTLDRVLAPPPASAALAGPPPEAPSGSSRWVLSAAALIVMAGAAIRLAALSTSIWFDESVTVNDVSGSFGQMLHRVVNHEASPPFYFVSLWIWRHLVGDTGADLRALSALAGTMTIALAFYVARRRIGPRAGLILAACVAVSPVLVYYSTEMRMYGVLVLITGIGFEAFLRASESPNRTNLSVWATVSVLALWTHYYAALAVAPQAVWLIVLAWRERSRWGGAVVAVGGVALGGLPLLYLLPYQTRHAFAYGSPLLSSAWQRVPTSIHVNGTLGDVVQEVTVGPAGPARAALTFIAVLIVGLAVVRGLRRLHPPPGELVRGWVLIAPGLATVTVLVILHVLVEGRYLLALWLPVGLGVCYMLATGSAGWFDLGLAGLLICVWVAISVLSLTVPRFAGRDDTRGAARSLRVAATHRLIAIDQPWDLLTLKQYRPAASTDTEPIVRVREVDVIAMPLDAEPAPAEHRRPSALGAGALPRGFALAQVIRGSTFLVERFVALRPLAVRVDGRGGAFRSGSWRFVTEPAGAGIGTL